MRLVVDDGLPSMPPPEPNGFTRTLNRMGYMTAALDPFSEEFVRFAATARHPVAETPYLGTFRSFIPTYERLKR